VKRPRPRDDTHLLFASAQGCHTTRRRTGTTPYADRVDISLRPLTRGDIPGWADLLARIEKVDRMGEHYGAADLEEEMANPEVVVGKDFVGAFDGPDMVGYYSVLPRGEAGGHFMIHVEGSVLPARRGQGIGTLLVAGMVERAARARAEMRPDLPAKLTCVGLTSNLAQRDLLGSAGMRAERWSFRMRTPLDDLPPTRPVPDGYGLRTYDQSLADVLRETHNRAFRDNPNFKPWSKITWKQFVTGSRSFRPQLSFVVVLDGFDEIVAYLQTAEADASLGATGRREAYVARIGTLQEHRGQGLAAALLGHSLQAYRGAGYDEAALDVDSENPSGALGVYERAGFKVESPWTSYFLMVVPDPGFAPTLSSQKTTVAQVISVSDPSVTE
jgi:mycothiol synthase